MSKFFTPALQSWMGGYQPILAEGIVNDKKAKANRAQARALSQRRAEGKPLGGWGDGTIGGLGKNVPGKTLISGARYESSRACPKGHVGLRYYSNQGCVECDLIRRRKA